MPLFGFFGPPGLPTRPREVKLPERQALVRRDYRPVGPQEQTAQADVVPHVVGSGNGGADDGTALFGGVRYRAPGCLGVYDVASFRAPESWQQPAYPPKQRGLVVAQAPGTQGSVIVLSRTPRPTDYLLGYRQINPSDPGSSATPLGYG